MNVAPPAIDHYTLLVVRADGVAPVVDILPADGASSPSDRAMALLKEHASGETVEVWRAGVLMESFRRA